MKTEILVRQMPLDSLVYADGDQIRNLLFGWGLTEQYVVQNLHILFEFCFWNSLVRMGAYRGERDGVHNIQLNPHLLDWHFSKLNLIAVHELRHMWWNITAPGTFIHKDGFRMRPKSYREDDAEEKDCKKVEEISSRFKVLLCQKPISYIELGMLVLKYEESITK